MDPSQSNPDEVRAALDAYRADTERAVEELRLYLVPHGATVAARAAILDATPEELTHLARQLEESRRNGPPRTITVTMSPPEPPPPEPRKVTKAVIRDENGRITGIQELEDEQGQ